MSDRSDMRFVLDVHLGKLAYHLRMLGFDSLYKNDYSDDQLRGMAKEEERVLLSKDRKLLALLPPTRGMFIHSADPREQLIEVLRTQNLSDALLPFTRCLLCNTVLESMHKENALPRIPQKVFTLFEEFQHCPTCHRIYWKGSHYLRMQEFIKEVLSVVNSEARATIERVTDLRR